MRHDQWDFYEKFKYGTQMKKQANRGDKLSTVLAAGWLQVFTR